MERKRTCGITAVAVLNLCFGGIAILDGLYLLLGCLVLMYQFLQFGFFEVPALRLAFSLLMLATGIVGLAAGIGIFRLRRWARTLSLAYAGLLIASCFGSFFAAPVIDTVGTYHIGSLDAYGLARLMIFGTIYIVIPVPYSAILCVIFYKSAWKTPFSKDLAA